MENRGEGSSVEDVLKISVETLARLALKQQEHLQQLTAPGPDLATTMMQLVPMVMPMIQAAFARPQVAPFGAAERRARADAVVKQAELAREIQELIVEARAVDEASPAPASNGAAAHVSGVSVAHG
jgi:hypothetical protein